MPGAEGVGVGLDSPVWVLGGREDDAATAGRPAGLARARARRLRHAEFPGGHFFVASEAASLVEFSLGTRLLSLL